MKVVYRSAVGFVHIIERKDDWAVVHYGKTYGAYTTLKSAQQRARRLVRRHLTDQP